MYFNGAQGLLKDTDQDISLALSFKKWAEFSIVEHDFDTISVKSCKDVCSLSAI